MLCQSASIHRIHCKSFLFVLFDAGCCQFCSLCSLWVFSMRTCADYCFKHRSTGSPTFAYLSSPSHEVSSHDVRLQPGPSPCFCLFDEGAFMWAVPFSWSKIIWHLGIRLIVFIFSYVQCVIVLSPFLYVLVLCWITWQN